MTAKTGIGIGCAVQFAALVVLACVLSEETANRMLRWMLLLLPLALLVRGLLTLKGLLSGWHHACIGPSFFVTALCLLGLYPLPMGLAPSTPRPSLTERPFLPSHPARPPKPCVQPAANAQAELASALAELDAMVGLKGVKDEVHRLASFVSMAEERRKAGLKAAPPSEYHFIFTGNPGTGKTTVAQLLGRIFWALGVLPKGHLVEVGRPSFIGANRRATQAKTREILDQARGGVLFIDEAHTLTGDGREYGPEIISTLLERMADKDERLVVVLSGRQDEMDRFLAQNPALRGRFSRRFRFPDYSARELAEMFRRLAAKDGYVLSADAAHWLEPALSVWTKNRDRNFANGRYVRDLFGRTLERQSARLSGVSRPTKEEMVTLTLRDIGISLKDPDASAED